MALGATRNDFLCSAAYDLCLKCSHLFNILDARGAISVTERVGVIARVRALAVGIAKAYVDQQRDDAPAEVGQQPRQEKRQRTQEREVVVRGIAVLRFSVAPPSAGRMPALHKSITYLTCLIFCSRSVAKKSRRG